MVTYRHITTPDQAQAAKFRGSPTIRIDGPDPFDPGGDGIGFTFRVYPTPDESPGPRRATS